VKAKFRRCR